MGIFSAIGGVIGLGNTLAGLGDKIADAYKAKQDALTDRDRIAAEERIKTLEMQRDVLVAEQANASTRWMRPSLVAIVWVVLFKLLVFDKVIGSVFACAGPGGGAKGYCTVFRTDGLDSEAWWFITVVIAALFVTRPFEKWATARKEK